MSTLNFSYNTVSKNIENILFKIKGSKFIGFLSKVENEEMANSYLREIQKIHPKATHHCFAYRIGTEGEIHRISDDGEPSGTAGLPIYNQLLSEKITNIMLIVVRYYGGTKLGTAGLIKAYRETAKLTIMEAEIITKDLEKQTEIYFPYDFQQQVFNILQKYQAEILSFETTSECKILSKYAAKHQKKISEDFSKIYQIKLNIL